VSKLQIGQGVVRISAGMVEILLNSYQQRQSINESQLVLRFLSRDNDSESSNDLQRG